MFQPILLLERSILFLLGWAAWVAISQDSLGEVLWLHGVDVTYNAVPLFIQSQTLRIQHAALLLRWPNLYNLIKPLVFVCFFKVPSYHVSSRQWSGAEPWNHAPDTAIATAYLDYVGVRLWGVRWGLVCVRAYCWSQSGNPT